jgi:hypothetical protein
MRLENLRLSQTIYGILPDCLVTAVGVQWFGPEEIELTYKGPAGRPGNATNRAWRWLGKAAPGQLRGRFRGRVHVVDVSNMMRRMVFDSAGEPLRGAKRCTTARRRRSTPTSAGCGTSSTVSRPRNGKSALGSRIAEVHNGSSLFTGDAGQGESSIRRRNHSSDDIMMGAS